MPSAYLYQIRTFTSRETGAPKVCMFIFSLRVNVRESRVPEQRFCQPDGNHTLVGQSMTENDSVDSWLK